MKPDSVNLNEIISEGSSVTMSLFDRDYTKTTLFILQMLGFRYVAMPSTFMNAFVGDAEHIASSDYALYLLFKLDLKKAFRQPDWVKYEANLRQHPCFQYLYYVGKDKDTAEDLVMYVYEVPELFRDDYTTFLQGQYSKFSDAYKSIFPRLTLVNNQSMPSLHYRVIQKDEIVKEQLENMLGTYLEDGAELWPIPDLAREVYRNK